MLAMLFAKFVSFYLKEQKNIRIVDHRMLDRIPVTCSDTSSYGWSMWVGGGDVDVGI